MRNSIQLPKTLTGLDMDIARLSDQLKLVNAREILNFFSSEEFTPELLIYYFMATFNQPGPHQYLTQKLRNMPQKFVEYYIPQLCYMVIKIGSTSMEAFLEHQCSMKISNFFKILWCLSAYSENERKDPKSKKEIEKLERRFEKSMVNGAVTFTKEYIAQNMHSVEFQIQLTKQFAEKEFRSAYIPMVNNFLMHMIKLSLTLKLTDPPLRKPFLLDEIRKGNKSIKKMRNSQSDLPYYWGIALPFEKRYEHEEASDMIVRILETGYACFNTKTRVPYRILVETISSKEVTFKSTQLLSENNTECDQDDLLQRDVSDDLESQLRYHTNAKHDDDIYKDLARYKSQTPSLQDLEQVDTPELSPIKQKDTTMSAPQKKRRGSWSISQDQSDNPQDGKSHKAMGDLDIRKQKRQPTEVSQFIIAKSAHLLDDINQKEEQYKVEKQGGNNNNKQKIVVKLHGPWGEDWDSKLAELKESSPFKDFESYRIRAIMVKGGDDLRQELFAMQLIQKIDDIFRSAYLNLFLKPYEIIVTSENSGILEFVPNTLSLDGLKKHIEKKSLYQFFKEYFSEDFYTAQRNFTESLAGYSLVCYVLQIRDRHNGNILIDNQGHLIHIDFGFMLSTSPGNMGFERAPFKLTREYMQLMDGSNSRIFEYFRQLMYYGFMELRKNCAALFQIVEIMMEKSNFHCFKFFKMDEFKQRFRQHDTEEECHKYVDMLIDCSMEDWRTVQYDNFQKYTNGIAP